MVFMQKKKKINKLQTCNEENPKTLTKESENMKKFRNELL